MSQSINLGSLTKNELLIKAKELNIAGRWNMKKAQLINAIETVLKTEELKEENASDEPRAKSSYIERIEKGMLVAFALPNGKVKSAKVEKKSLLNRKLKLITEYGVEYIISFDDVLWVKTGKRWPKGIYNLLKGLTSYAGAGKESNSVNKS